MRRRQKTEIRAVVSDSATPQTVASQAPLSMEFSRQEYWSGLSFPPPRHFLDPVIQTMSLMSPALADQFFNTTAINRDGLIISK